jgi:glyoxylase-like metal-dependent hydrolase (beta-lactamase superfamily II)
MKPASWIKTLRIPTPFPVGTVNVHVLLREPITLIDSGPLTGEAWDSLNEGLRQEGLALQDVRRVLLTHGHPDHYGLAARVADASKAALFGGGQDRRNFRQQHNTKLLLDSMARAGFGLGPRLAVTASVVAIDRFAEPLLAWNELGGGESLEGDGYHVVVRSTPGHTPGSLTFEIPEAHILFTGDTILKRITPNAVVEEDPENPGQPFRSVSRYFETLEEIGETNGRSMLLTGHGPPIANWPAHRRDLARRYALRTAEIERGLQHGPSTIRDLVVRIFPRVKTLNVFLAFSEILGFLMYLEDRGRVEKLAAPRRDLYRLSPGTKAA